MLRELPLIALGLFWLLDGLANFRLIPSESVSELVWREGWGCRVFAASLLVLLASHLLLQWPMSPAK